MEKARDFLFWNTSIVIRKAFKKDATTIVNLLIIKEEKYLEAALVAIKSILARNWDFKIRIHTDMALFERVVSLMRSQKLLSFIQVQIVNEDDDWMITKFGLLLAMQGTNEIYIDADTRCNGKIPKQNQVSCYVNEGELLNSGTYATLLANYQPYLFPKKMFMLNTSYFTWGGKTCGEIPDPKILLLELIQILEHTSARRLSEQICISLIIQNFHEDFRVLKESDRTYDHGILESSYLGTTGRQIYRR